MRWFEIAEESSKKSSYPRINIGAAIVLGNYLVATGYNQQKTHPKQAKFNEMYSEFESSHYLHAEVHALINSARENIEGADIYVFRRNREGSLANCRPCPVCYEAAKAAGISRIYYTTEDGYYFENLNGYS
jgi:deoxycytidylate deaminase